MKTLLLALMSMACVFAKVNVEAIPISANIVALKSENQIDFKVSGSTMILSGLSADFIPVDISFYGDAITGTVGFPQTPLFSIGWTSPNYADVVSLMYSPVSSTGYSSSFSIGNTQNITQGKSPVIPAGTNVFLNVVSPDVSSITNLQHVYITGYYLF